jgi:hypothetical protein
MEDRFSYILDNIRKWLSEEDIQYNPKENSENEFTFWYSKGIKLEVNVNNDKLTISYEHFFHKDIKKFLTQYNFNELDLLLHQQIPNFILLSNKLNPNELVGIKFISDIWAESLTKTLFFHTIIAVQHSVYTVWIKERQWQMVNN